MRPRGLKTRIFLDSGDPLETKEIIGGEKRISRFETRAHRRADQRRQQRRQDHVADEAPNHRRDRRQQLEAGVHGIGGCHDRLVPGVPYRAHDPAERIARHGDVHDDLMMRRTISRVVPAG